jgi:hypothetical protein
MTVRLSGHAASVLDGGRTPLWAPGHLAFGASWAPLVSGIPATVEIETRFDAPRRDIRALLQASAAPGAGNGRAARALRRRPLRFDLPSPARGPQRSLQLDALRAAAVGRTGPTRSVAIAATLTLTQADAFDPLVRFGAAFADPPAPGLGETMLPPAFAIAGSPP